jgi:CHAD domain-containing protein
VAGSIHLGRAAKEPSVRKAAAAAAAAGAAVAAGKLVHHRLAGREEPKAFRLLPGEPLPEGLARVGRGRIDHALEGLRGGEDPDKAVHEARKDMKKLRAVLRLARGELGEKTYGRENARFREVARGLSGARDSKAMLEALDGLEESGLHGSDVSRLRGELERHKELLAGHDGLPVKGAIADLKRAREGIDEWPLERDGWSALRPGLRRVYRAGRRRMSAAEKDPTTESLHEWRKRAKDLWYHLALLGESWPPVLEAAADEAHALSNRLGDDHDLAVLLDFAVEHNLASHRLRSAVERRREELQGSAFEIGKRLYAERPRVFVDRLRSYWDAWRADSVPA